MSGFVLMCIVIALPSVWVIGGLIVKDKADEVFGKPLLEHKMRKIIALPAYLLYSSGYSAQMAYDRKIKVHIVEYFGKPDSDKLFLLHQAGKLTYMCLAIEFCLIIGSQAQMDTGYALFCAMLVCGVFALPDSRLGADIRKRKIDIMLDFPDFLVKLTLLINAGMNVTFAWQLVSEGTDKKRALGRELEMALWEIRSGKSESKAYEDFAKRCRIQEITRVVSVLLQNMKKGNSELVSILRVHANECWEMRKNAAKKLGEEASSKMLLPMGIMLLSILIIVTTPAVLALQGLI